MSKIKSITLNTIKLEDIEIVNETLAQYDRYCDPKNIVTL